jgi:hypothetical protein
MPNINMKRLPKTMKILVRGVVNLTGIRNEYPISQYYLAGNIDVKTMTTQIIWKTQYSSPVMIHLAWKSTGFWRIYFTGHDKLAFFNNLIFLKTYIVSLAFWRVEKLANIILRPVNLFSADVLTKASNAHTRIPGSNIYADIGNHDWEFYGFPHLPLRNVTWSALK